jgi:hypothetical protein
MMELNILASHVPGIRGRPLQGSADIDGCGSRRESSRWILWHHTTGGLSGADIKLVPAVDGEDSTDNRDSITFG